MSNKKNSKHKNSTVESYNFISSIKSKPRVTALVSFVVLLLALDLVGFGGNIRFYAKWAQCGQKPVAIGSPWPSGAGGMSYYYETRILDPIRLSPHLYCAPLDAELHGYSASRYNYEFPALEADRGKVCRYENEPESVTGQVIWPCDVVK